MKKDVSVAGDCVMSCWPHCSLWFSVFSVFLFGGFGGFGFFGFGNLEICFFRKLHRGHRGPQRFGRPVGDWMIVCEGAVLFFSPKEAQKAQKFRRVVCIGNLRDFDNHGLHG